MISKHPETNDAIPDLLSSWKSGRNIVLINRYVPFYREGILRRVADWKSLLVLYSGRTLGNLKTVESVETCAVKAYEKWGDANGHIIWLACTLKLFQARPQIVCSEMSLSLLSTWWLFCLRPFFGFRLVFWTHGFQTFGWHNEKMDWKDRLRLLWMKWADAILFYSEARKADVEKVTGANARYFVAPNTVDTSTYARLFDTLELEGRKNVQARLRFKEPAMIYVGRLTADKEVMGLAELLRLAAGCNIPPNLIVVGGGELADALQSACSALKDRIRFYGPLFDARKLGELIYCSDIMVCPGYVGLNVVDSLAMGCPFATIHDSQLVKRHSPEVGYLKEGQNALFGSSLPDLGRRLCEWFDCGMGISLDRREIRSRFLDSSSVERQLSGMKAAFEAAMHRIK